MSDTPETDAFSNNKFHDRAHELTELYNFTMGLERELYAAKELIESLEDALIEIEACCYEDDSENAAADASWHVARKALRKLKEWTKGQEAVS